MWTGHKGLASAQELLMKAEGSYLEAVESCLFMELAELTSTEAKQRSLDLMEKWTVVGFEMENVLPRKTILLLKRRWQRCCDHDLREVTRVWATANKKGMRWILQDISRKDLTKLTSCFSTAHIKRWLWSLKPERAGRKLQLTPGETVWQT